MNHLVSIIIICKNEKEYLKMTLDSFLAAKNTTPIEMIVVDDGSTDGSCDFLTDSPYCNSIQLFKTDNLGISNAKNFGAAHAQGDVLVFSDAHVTVPDQWLDKLMACMDETKADMITPAVGDLYNPEKIGYGMSFSDTAQVFWYDKKDDKPYETPVVCGCFTVVKKNVFDDIYGFDKNYRNWGVEDVEITMKLWLFGYKAYVCPDVVVRHMFRSTPPPYNIDLTYMYSNLLYCAISHFTSERIDKIKALIKKGLDGMDTQQDEIKNKIWLDVTENAQKEAIWQQRADYFKRRKYDDDWYFSRFGIAF